MVSIIKNRYFIMALSAFTLLSGCGITYAPENSNNTLSSENHGVALAVEKFGQNLAEHIIRHPDSANVIHCKTIPILAGQTDDRQLCTLETMVYEPVYVNKVTFFIKHPNGKIQVLNELGDSGNSSFSYFEFSEKGKYLSVIFTDEGHPYFVFFDTQQFLIDPDKAQVGEVFEEYYIDHIEKFYDNGDFIFALREETIYGCLSGEIEIEPKTDTTEEVKRCLFHHNIFDQYNSFSSREPFLPSRSKRSVKMPYVCHAYE